MIRPERKHNDEENDVFSNTHFYSTSPSTKEAMKGARTTLTDGVRAPSTGSERRRRGLPQSNTFPSLAAGVGMSRAFKGNGGKTTSLVGSEAWGDGLRE